MLLGESSRIPSLFSTLSFSSTAPTLLLLVGSVERAEAEKKAGANVTAVLLLVGDRGSEGRRFGGGGAAGTMVRLGSQRISSKLGSQ